MLLNHYSFFSSTEPRYNIAIESARSSKFIHEEGLAWYVLDTRCSLVTAAIDSIHLCEYLFHLIHSNIRFIFQSELAAKHYERNSDPEMAISSFRRAKKCY